MPSNPNLPPKPYPEFPLFAHKNGQWRKDIWSPSLRRSVSHYFGTWSDDPRGERALATYMASKEAIATGTYRAPRHQAVVTTYQVNDLIRDYLEHRAMDVHSQKLTLTTFLDITAEVNDFGAWLTQNVGPAVAVTGLKPDIFAFYVNYLLEDRTAGGRGLGRWAEKRVKSYIKTMFRWGADNGKFSMPPMGSAWKAPNTGKSAMRIYRMRRGLADHSDRIATGDEIRRLVKAAPVQHKALILLAVNCGLGPADLGRLRWRHLNTETGELNMFRGKTGESRRGYLWKRTRKALQKVRDLKHNRKLIEGMGQEALVFVTRRGLPFFREEARVTRAGKVACASGHQAFYTTFRRLTKKLGISDLSPYKLRHTFATIARYVGKPEVVDRMMGHCEGRVSAIYDHTVENFAQWHFDEVKRVAIKVKNVLWPRPQSKQERRAGNG